MRSRRLRAALRESVRGGLDAPGRRMAGSRREGGVRDRHPDRHAARRVRVVSSTSLRDRRSYAFPLSVRRVAMRSRRGSPATGGWINDIAAGDRFILRAGGGALRYGGRGFPGGTFVFPTGCFAPMLRGPEASERPQDRARPSPVGWCYLVGSGNAGDSGRSTRHAWGSGAGCAPLWTYDVGRQRARRSASVRSPTTPCTWAVRMPASHAMFRRGGKTRGMLRCRRPIGGAMGGPPHLRPGDRGPGALVLRRRAASRSPLTGPEPCQRSRLD